MRSFLGSIRFRIVAIYLIVMVLAFVAISGVVGELVKGFLVSQRTLAQLSETEHLALAIAPLYEKQDVEALYAYSSEWTKQTGGRVLLLDTDAVVQLDTASEFNGYRLPYREVREVLLARAGSSYGFHKLTNLNEFGKALTFLTSTSWVVYYTAPITLEGTQLGVLLYASSIQDAVESVDTITKQIGLVFLIFAVAVGIISLIVSGWLTRPILVLTNAIRRVGAQGYSERVPVRGKDELATLADAFNIMSEKLENHDRLRNEFVSNASHELKTPLSTMKILAESMLYQDEPDPKTTREFFADINHEIDRLNNTINDLLRLVQNENEERTLNIAEVDLEALVLRVIRRLMPIAKKKGIRLERKMLPVTIEADEARLEQVVVNLIDNALKYTDKGAVAVTLKPDGAFAALIVHDTGIGIPKGAVPRLFERFYRVDKARSRETGGTGLGLSIVERIVSMHGGYIQVESVVGRGTTFTVRLPIRHNPREEASHE
ncbi:MAG: Alkaline phosphatase synthesis sensor protein PhoR [Firmicutes bacterium ADurb.Bin356]|nr:MAG: Alkaline phosphatase synthesis sensor protein PhoR [Firmicutes bacterium ADurb.Bin356]